MTPNRLLRARIAILALARHDSHLQVCQEVVLVTALWPLILSMALSYGVLILIPWACSWAWPCLVVEILSLGEQSGQGGGRGVRPLGLPA